MKKKGNFLSNDASHHLFAIIEKETNEIFKYGISLGPFDDSGYSLRMREQLKLANPVALEPRYFARTILLNIPGREEALRIEKEYIENFRREHGYPPRGNSDRKSKHG